MVRDSHYFPVIIIGGGPAGLATSLTLSARGIPHCIVDANEVPVNKPGEAIPPNAKPLLKQLGIDHLIDNKRHLPYYGNKACWGDDTLRQEEFITDVHGHGYLLNRLLFETELREHITSALCTNFWGYKLRLVEQQDQETIVRIEGSSESHELRCRYVVDATGRKASVCRQLGVLKTALDEQFALTLQVPIRNNMAHQIHIEAIENGWWYAALLGQSQMNLMFFASKSLIPAKSDLPEFLENALNKSIYIKKLIDKSLLPLNATEIRVIPAGTSCLDVPYGANWLAVGDAAYAYDPISSYGITSGLGAGYYAGHTLADALDGKQEAFDVYRYLMENAFQAYLEKLENHYALEQRWPQSGYWVNRINMTPVA
ncbi:MAG: NAD(P)/FAD-dependent oxidoreductase [Roseivirga sp.]|nr:NAD(P)/FAD-dependent oxidoreductase [Roseivirga sp.]